MSVGVGQVWVEERRSRIVVLPGQSLGQRSTASPVCLGRGWRCVVWVVKVEWVECLCVTLGIEFVPLKLKGGASVFILDRSFGSSVGSDVGDRGAVPPGAGQTVPLGWGNGVEGLGAAERRRAPADPLGVVQVAWIKLGE